MHETRECFFQRAFHGQKEKSQNRQSEEQEAEGTDDNAGHGGTWIRFRGPSRRLARPVRAYWPTATGHTGAGNSDSGPDRQARLSERLSSRYQHMKRGGSAGPP